MKKLILALALANLAAAAAPVLAKSTDAGFANLPLASQAVERKHGRCPSGDVRPGCLGV